MALQAAFVLRNGVEHARDAVRNVVAHHVADVERGYNHTDGRQEDVKVVAALQIDVAGEVAGYVVNKKLQHNGGKTAEHTHKQGEHNDELALVDVPFAPLEKAEKHLLEAA